MFVILLLSLSIFFTNMCPCGLSRGNVIFIFFVQLLARFLTDFKTDELFNVDVYIFLCMFKHNNSVICKGICNIRYFPFSFFFINLMMNFVVTTIQCQKKSVQLFFLKRIFNVYKILFSTIRNVLAKFLNQTFMV